jgi:hypothetical protein
MLILLLVVLLFAISAGPQWDFDPLLSWWELLKIKLKVLTDKIKFW